MKSLPELSVCVSQIIPNAEYVDSHLVSLISWPPKPTSLEALFGMCQT